MTFSDQALVTIITPCYNYGKFLAEALDSLLLQTYSNWECVIVNDGSIDNTDEVALQYTAKDQRFKYINQKNGGLPNARNAALKMAQGKYIQLLDADDLLESKKLELQVALFENNSNYDLIYSAVALFANQDEERVYSPFFFNELPRLSGKDQTIIKLLMKDVFFLPGCVIFRKSVFEKVGFFNETLYGLEDWNYWFRAALLGCEFYYDERENTRLLARDHDANMSKVYYKMLKARINAREHVMHITKKLNIENKLNLDSAYIKEMILQHNISINENLYEYQSHEGYKLAAVKSLLKYSYYARKPFFPFKKITDSVLTRMFKN